MLNKPSSHWAPAALYYAPPALPGLITVIPSPLPAVLLATSNCGPSMASSSLTALSWRMGLRTAFGLSRSVAMEDMMMPIGLEAIMTA